MCSRTSSALGLLALLAACMDAQSSPPGDEVYCAMGAGADFAPVCTLERVAGGAQFVLHHPDGGFRRLTSDPVTGALAPFDGADPLLSVVDDGQALQFAIGQNRYRIARALLEPSAR